MAMNFWWDEVDVVMGGDLVKSINANIIKGNIMAVMIEAEIIAVYVGVKSVSKVQE